MARLRNPRFAPEFLERRLNPSVSIASVAACVVCMDDPDPQPAPGPGSPQPLPPPTAPIPIQPG